MSSKQHRRKHCRPLNMKACKPGMSRMDMLFEQIKTMEKENRGKKIIAEIPETEDSMAEPSLADGQLDRNLEAETHKKIEKHQVIEAEHNMSRKLQKFEFEEEQENEDYYIASDTLLSPMMDYEEILEGFIDMMNRVDQQYVYCNNKQSECDRKIQDFLHELRMPKKNACEGFKLYQLGHNIQIQRQAYKDAIEVLRPLANFANANRELIAKLQNISDRQKSRRDLIDNRVYMPRSDLDLPVGDAFRALSKEEQERIRENYENSKRRAC